MRVSQQTKAGKLSFRDPPLKSDHELLPQAGRTKLYMDIGMRFKLIRIDIVWVSYILIEEVAKLFS